MRALVCPILRRPLSHATALPGRQIARRSLSSFVDREWWGPGSLISPASFAPDSASLPWGFVSRSEYYDHLGELAGAHTELARQEYEELGVGTLEEFEEGAEHAYLYIAQAYKEKDADFFEHQGHGTLGPGLAALFTDTLEHNTGRGVPGAGEAVCKGAADEVVATVLVVRQQPKMDHNPLGDMVDARSVGGLFLIWAYNWMWGPWVTSICVRFDPVPPPVSPETAATADDGAVGKNTGEEPGEEPAGEGADGNDNDTDEAMAARISALLEDSKTLLEEFDSKKSKGGADANSTTDTTSGPASDAPPGDMSAMQQFLNDQRAKIEAGQGAELLDKAALQAALAADKEGQRHGRKDSGQHIWHFEGEIVSATQHSSGDDGDDKLNPWLAPFVQLLHRAFSKDGGNSPKRGRGEEGGEVDAEDATVQWSVQNINHSSSVNIPPEVGQHWRAVNARNNEADSQ